MRLFLLWLLFFLACHAVPLPGYAQPAPKPAAAATDLQVTLELGATAFPVTEYFTISFRLQGGRLERYSAFPDLEGFKKSGKSSTTTTRIVEGRTTTELIITQRYAAYEEGEFVVKPFTMTVNGQTVRSAGATLAVGPAPVAATPGTPPVGGGLQGLGLLDQLFGKPKPQEYVEPKDNAFLALVPDKTSVFVGEGVHVGLYFYLTPNDQGLLDFYNFAGQLPAILRQLRQRTAWEEPFDEQEILPETVTMGGRQFIRFRLYEAQFYPLNTEPLTFPAVALQMVKYRVAKKPAEGLDNRLEGYKTYYTAARRVQVKPLPPHPLRDQVPVGSYQLREAIDRTAFRTGQAFTYSFGVEGEGNLAALNAPAVRPRPGLEVYGPDVRQELTRQGGRVGGRKVFQYRFVGRNPGPVPLDSLLALVYFDPATGRYDTLHPELSPLLRGPVRGTAEFRARPDDPFYQKVLFDASSTMQPLDTYHDVRRYANYILAALLVVAAWGWWRGRR
ncbi:BatD family protein [Hymenobacter psychrotolerans]|uniref:Oxygen tolerance n=1 Tax=Hymenobacter psychrotolerans DSM 18569 TaxID=1121959 RepID=A0A1M6RVF8_9BACT|nr:BatD family protein [Hymenobacter psychrotolerans]SHK36414.1 Oxygen tolerance [Hymenobacter psychrotolerans DSM 18569]